MPEMSGHELHQHIRSSHPALPVLVISGDSDDTREMPIPMDKVTGFLQKPYRKGELLRALSSLMQQALQSNQGLNRQ